LILSQQPWEKRPKLKKITQRIKKKLKKTPKADRWGREAPHCLLIIGFFVGNLGKMSQFLFDADFAVAGHGRGCQTEQLNIPKTSVRPEPEKKPRKPHF
jgi:hypothetical protein